jgi:RNA polymerase sigma-70 factor (ECF subfamily)
MPDATPANTDERLIQQSKDGDEMAFAELVCRYRVAMINLIYRMCNDIHLAEDAAQTAFLHAWQRLDSYQPGTNLRGWLYRIAINAALDVLRSTRPVTDLESENLVDSGAGPEAAVEKREISQLVQKAVLSLPPASRAVLVLREYEGLSYKEIAETLEISTGTVMSRLSYARTTLQARLAPFLIEVDDEPSG